MKFYPADWRSDPMLRICSLSARGLWLEMIALMHEASPYGHLLIGGKAPTEKQLATLVGADLAALRSSMDELNSAGVFSVNEDGVVFSRRMVRDFDKASADKANGKKGGNPKVKGQVNPPSSSGVNPRDNGEDKAQKLEARSQSSVTDVTGGEPPVDPVKVLFDAGVVLLRDAGSTEAAARTLIGRWRKLASDDTVLGAIQRCRSLSITDPVSWMTATLTPAASRKQSPLQLQPAPDYEAGL